MPQRTTVQMFAMLVALAFVGVGILGFIPGITTDYGDCTSPSAWRWWCSAS